jgi:hypothetical protein
MPLNGFSLSDIVTRVMLVLPSRFSREDGTDVVNFFTGIAAALKINSEQVDELFRQTNLVSASGEYVDEYIVDLIDYGRKEDESDEDYKTRYKRIAFRYNSTRQGLAYVSLDLLGTEPYGMYNGTARGAYFNSGYFLDDDFFLSTYGDEGEEMFVGYIEFGRKPNEDVFDELCKTIAAAKAAGIRVYLKYPLGNDLVASLLDGILERAILV